MRLPRPLIALLWMITATGMAQAADRPAPLAFAAPMAADVPPGFGPAKPKRQADRSSDRDERYARGLFDKYDANGDRILQEAEWRRIRGNPERADANGDGRITFDELVARVSKRRAERAAESRRNASSSNAKNSDADGVRRSYRLRAASETLPAGLPSWFADRDRNGDGQVAMHEYSCRWSDSTARRFTRLDADDDGLVSPAEALRER